MVTSFLQGCLSGAFYCHKEVSPQMLLCQRESMPLVLFDLYNIFCDVVTERRIKDNDENTKNKDGFPEIYLPHVTILQHASKIYTNNLYKVFENEYIKGEGCCQDLLSSSETLQYRA